MREAFPGGIEQKSSVERRGSRARSARRVLVSTLDTKRSTHGEPCLEILLKTLLCFEVVSDHDNGSQGEKVMQQGREEWLGRGTDAGTSQCAARLQSPGEGLHGGSLRNSVEQRACRRGLRILRQAPGRLQAGRGASSTVPCRKRRTSNSGNFQIPVLLPAAMVSENKPSTCARDSAPTRRFSTSVLTTGIFCCSLISASGSTSTNR